MTKLFLNFQCYQFFYFKYPFLQFVHLCISTLLLWCQGNIRRDLLCQCFALRSMLFCGTWSMCLAHMHRYLCENLKPYSTDCCAVYPSDKLCPASSSDSSTELSIVYKSYEGNYATVVESEVLVPFQIDSQITEGGQTFKNRNSTTNLLLNATTRFDPSTCGWNILKVRQD